MTTARARISAQTIAPAPVLLPAPAHWQRLDFISDLHLKEAEPATFDAWRGFMQTTRAHAVFILGDLFDVWVGDDVTPDSFEARCAQVLRAASKRLDIFFLHGNRDFLLGSGFARACGMTLLSDPTLLDFAGQRWMLSHGDALCLADTEYLQFRAMVRSAPWQQDFLGQPLAQRQSIARSLRAQSEARKQARASYTEVDALAACDWLCAAQASTLIHGHTHQPGDHPLPASPANHATDGLRRLVLSDWDATATPARLQVLRLSAGEAGRAPGYRLERMQASSDAATS